MKSERNKVYCPFCGIELVPVYETVIVRPIEKKPKTEIKLIKWKCLAGCCYVVPITDEDINDIWIDEQRYKRSMSSPGGSSTKSKRKRYKPVRWINDYDEV